MSKAFASVLFLSLVVALTGCPSQEPAPTPTPTVTPTEAPTVPPTPMDTPTPGEMSVTGCVKKGVEAGCWVVTDAGGAQFSFQSETAAENSCFEITGTQVEAGICMQGTQLNVTKFEKSELDCCQLQ